MKTRLVFLAAALALIGLLAALPKLTGKSYDELAADGGQWFKPAAPTGKGAGGPGAGGPPPIVSVAPPLQKSVIEWDEYTGRFDAVEAVDVRARISGYLNEVHFTDGQMVKEGDLLFSIDPRPFERALDQARAEYEQAKTRVSNAKLDVDRGKPLLKTNAISQKTQDDRENVLRDAEAATKITEARVKTAELELSFCRVTAPISGRMSRKLVTPGNFISGGGTPDGTTVLTSIVTQDPIYIYFDVGEHDALKYRRLAAKGVKDAGDVGAAVGVALPDEDGFPHTGKLDFLENRLDASTGTLRARASLANPNAMFSAGMFARVRLQGSEEYDGLLLPDQAIGTDQASRFVYVIDADNKAQRKSVKLGPLIGGLRLVREGIARDDKVVVNGIQKVRAGQPVSPKPASVDVSASSSVPQGTASPVR